MFGLADLQAIAVECNFCARTRVVRSRFAGVVGDELGTLVLLYGRGGRGGRGGGVN